MAQRRGEPMAKQRKDEACLNEKTHGGYFLECCSDIRATFLVAGTRKQMQSILAFNRVEKTGHSFGLS
jgi:hypothetical protein